MAGREAGAARTGRLLASVGTATAAVLALAVAGCSSRGASTAEIGNQPSWTGRAWRPHYAFRFPMPELERFEGSLQSVGSDWAPTDEAYLRLTAAQVAGKYDDLTRASMPDTLDAPERARTLEAIETLGTPVAALREAGMDGSLSPVDLMVRLTDVRTAFEDVRGVLQLVTWRSDARRALEGFQQAMQPVWGGTDVAAIRRAAPELKARAEELGLRPLPEGVRAQAAANAQRSYQQLAAATGVLFRASIDGHPQPVVDAHAEVKEAYRIAVARTQEAFGTTAGVPAR